jgi:autotransporter-associated beta strand protein
MTGGAITNNGPAASTSTITLAGSGTSYDMFAAINNGTNGGKVALVTSIANTGSGNIYVLHSHAPSTYSGGTVVNSQSIQADASNAFGTGPITVTANNASTNSSQILLAPGVTIPNNITIAQGNPHPVNGTVPLGVIQQTASGGDTTVSGTITIQSNNVNDGLFNGPIANGVDYLNVTGPVNVSGTADTIVQIGGNVRYSGAGNYPNFLVTGVALLGANNGLSQTAAIQIANSGGGTLDLGGFDQTAASLSATTTNLALVQNSGTGANTLTLNTRGVSTFNGSINGNVNLTIAGNGTQILSGFNGNSGNTRINSGTLQMGADFALSSTTNLILSGGKFATDGHVQTFSTPLALTANSIIDLGAGASVLQFADSHTQTWTAGAILDVSGWTGNITGSGTDQLLIGDSSKTGLTAAQLSHIHFQGFHTGAALVLNGGNGEVVPANATRLLRGDVNQDNHVNTTDVMSLLTALTDINAYKAAHSSLDTFEAADILDVNQDGSVTNADLQGLLDYLKAGNGSLAAVPEPSSWLLLALGGVFCTLAWQTKRRLAGPKAAELPGLRVINSEKIIATRAYALIT